MTADKPSAQLTSEMRGNRQFCLSRVQTTHKPTPGLALVFGFRSHRLARLAGRAAEAVRDCFRPRVRTWRGQAERGVTKSGPPVAVEAVQATDGSSVGRRP